MIDNDIAFRAELKAHILASVDKDEPADGLRDDEPWFGPESRLDLNSLDALQISMVIHSKVIIVVSSCVTAAILSAKREWPS